MVRPVDPYPSDAFSIDDCTLLASKIWRVLREPLILLCFLFFAAFIRSFYFWELIDSDEEIFLVLGQDVLRGHLPYMHLWDLKPPLMYIIYALFSFYPSLPVSRFAGSLYMGVTAYVIYLCLRRMGWASAGMISGVLYLICMTQPFFSAAATMSEHVAALPMALVLLLLARQTLSPRQALAVGVLVGACGLIRTNQLLIGSAAALSILMMRQPWEQRLRNSVALASGTVLIYGFFILLYWMAGGLDILLATLTRAPWDIMEEVRQWQWLSIENTFQARVVSFYEHYPYLTWSVALSLVLLSRFRLESQQKRMVLTLIALFICIAASIYVSHMPWPHYSLQVILPAVMLVPLGFFAIPRDHLRRYGLFFMCAVLLYGQTSDYPSQWQKTKKQLQTRQTSGALEEVAYWLRQNDSKEQYLYACLTGTRLYFLSRTIPADGMAAQNMAYFLTFNRQFRNDPEYDLSRIRDKIAKRHPKFIVAEHEGCPKIPGMQEYIQQSYRLRERVEGYFIYQRLDDVADKE